MTKDVKIDLGSIWETMRTRLKERGIDLDFDLKDGFKVCCDGDMAERIKVVCVAPDLQESVEEMGKKQRDQVVMVRIDTDTLQDLDAWVATGAVKSRSEAAALFIREGLKVRADELEQLRDALREVEKAKEKLRTRAREIFGQEQTPSNEG